MQTISLFIQQHTLLCAALLLVLFLLTTIEYMRKRQQGTQINPAAAILLINREKAAVIDIRAKDEWKAGHIIGSISLPTADIAQNDKKLAKLQRNPVILACANGSASAQKAALFHAKGLDVSILAGGMNAWTAAGLPITRK